MTSALAVALLSLTFLAGASAGIVGDRLAGRASQPHVRATVEDMSPLFDRLALTPGQRVRAESIAARTAPRTRAIMVETAVRLRAVADSVDAELRAILTPAQRQRLDSLRRDMRFVLKRKAERAGEVRVDTILDTGAPGYVH